jgi:hypothetical protein
VVRQGKHVVMSDGVRLLTIPSAIRSMRSPWAASRDAGLTVELFKKLLEWRVPRSAALADRINSPKRRPWG